MSNALSTPIKIMIAIGLLASAGFVVTAVVIFSRTGDWPAKYFYAAALILLFVVIAMKRRRRQNQ